MIPWLEVSKTEILREFKIILKSPHLWSDPDESTVCGFGPIILRKFRKVSAENCGKFGVYKLGIGRKGPEQSSGGLKRKRPRREQD